MVCIELSQMAIAACVLITVFPAHTWDDEHHFIKYGTLTELDESVQMDRTMQGVSICDGREVLRSTDGVGSSVIHRMAGICSDPILDVLFGLRDLPPPELGHIHYSINLGLEGLGSIK